MKNQQDREQSLKAKLFNFKAIKNINLPVNNYYFAANLILRGGWNTITLQAAQELFINSSFNLNELQKFIYSESLAPLLYHIVRGQDIVPASIEKEWRNAYYQNACRNTLLLRQLTELLSKLAAVGVDVIVLKGAALGEIVYRDIAARPMSDLDLLIHPENLAVTRQVLTEFGYIATNLEMQVGFTEDFRNEEIFYKQGLVDTYIDLHWRLIAPVYYQQKFATDWFWETALSTKISSVPTLVLGYEAQVLYLCAHLMLHHGGNSLLWLHDIAAVINSFADQINWELIISKAKEYNLVMSLQQVLIQIADEWDSPIPPDILDKLLNLKPSQEEVRTYAWQYEIMALRLLADVAGAKDWRQRLRIAWDTLFPTREYMQHRYKIRYQLLIPFYYPYRWLRGLRRVPS